MAQSRRPPGLARTGPDWPGLEGTCNTGIRQCPDGEAITDRQVPAMKSSHLAPNGYLRAVAVGTLAGRVRARSPINPVASPMSAPGNPECQVPWGQ